MKEGILKLQSIILGLQIIFGNNTNNLTEHRS